MFEQASRLKLRFETSKGQWSAEDLWDVPLKNLDTIALALRAKLKDDDVSFISEKKPDPALQLSFDIVRHIITVRMAEQREAREARDKAEQKQKILGIIARKEDLKLEEMPIEDLRALAGGL